MMIETNKIGIQKHARNAQKRNAPKIAIKQACIGNRNQVSK